MRQFWQSILHLWEAKPGFKAAAAYLMLLLLLALSLPWLPLPYPPNYLDLAHPYLPPFKDIVHPLGTDGLGRDLLSNVLYGARTSFMISVPVMLFATAIGMLLGTTAGFFGNDSLQQPRYSVLFWLLSFPAVLYFAVYLPLQVYQLEMELTYIILPVAALTGWLLLMWLLLNALQRFVPFLKLKMAIPIDKVVMRLTEALTSIPRFVLILALASFIPPSLFMLSLLLIFTIWPATARLSRAEMLRIKQLPYFEAACSIGNRPFQLIWRHALPNLAGPILIAFTFGLGGLLTLESTLSFLNIGVPTSLVSWGRTISGIRSNTSAWWLVVFPGGLLSLTIMALYTCSYYFTQVFSQKGRR
ncbi:ABC transporter permease [uncultured Pontibacter sp.]|uniref:ABC transporter permease n=1 Tax=uncultured Pontibacter sp. TaxID=453356 RepID=UPI0026127D36|nr:ABC transporter permease [uncultured Pontibacter sp.]